MDEKPYRENNVYMIESKEADMSMDIAELRDEPKRPSLPSIKHPPTPILISGPTAKVDSGIQCDMSWMEE